jgi:hypothetical protein
VLPVLAGGLALFLAGQVLASRGARRAADGSAYAPDRSAYAYAAGLATILAAAVLSYVLVYRGGGHGQALGPLDFLSYTGVASIYRHASHSLLYALAACVAAPFVLCGLLAALAGALLVRDRWWPRSASASPERLLMCVLVASVAAFALFEVPGDSEVYYVVYGFLAASVVSAEGVVRAVRRLAPAKAELARVALGCAFAAFVAIAVLRAERSTAALAFAYVLLACVVVLSAVRLGRRRESGAARIRGYALASTVILVVGLTLMSETFEQAAPTVGRWLRGAPAYASADTSPGITTELRQGLLWLRDHTPSSAVIAVNYHGARDDESNYYYYSAFSERRVFLESWEETPQGYSYLLLGRHGSPFPRLLALNDAAVLHGSRAAISLLRVRYGVRYIVIDRAHGGVSAALARAARVVFANRAVVIFAIG